MTPRDRNRGAAPPDAARVAAAVREPRHRPIFDAISLNCAWQQTERTSS